MRHLNFSKYMVAGLMAASLLTTNTSCADYLDKEPDTELDIEMVFSNRDKVYQWLAFVYNTIHEPDKWRIWKDGYEVFADAGSNGMVKPPFLKSLVNGLSIRHGMAIFGV